MALLTVQIFHVRFAIWTCLTRTQEVRVPLNQTLLAWQHLNASHKLEELAPDAQIEISAIDGSLTMSGYVQAERG